MIRISLNSELNALSNLFSFSSIYKSLENARTKEKENNVTKHVYLNLTSQVFSIKNI
jgi:hypothetical protein